MTYAQEILVSHNSELYVENVWFQGNGRVGHDRGTGITVDYGSMATIINVTCIENVVGCVEIRDNSNVVVENSFFANNTFTAIYCEEAKLISKNSTFLMDPLVSTPFIYGELKLHLTIVDCHFYSLRVVDIYFFDLLKSSVVSVSNTNISFGSRTVFNSVFVVVDNSLIPNISGNTAVVKAHSQIQARFTNCIILSAATILDAEKPSSVTLDNYTILNSTIASIGMFRFMEGNVSMTNTTVSNIELGEGVFLHADSKSTVSFINCRYLDNRINQHFHINGGSTLNITGSEFINNGKSNTGNSLELIYSNQSNITIKSSNFLNNSVVLDSVNSSIILEECQIKKMWQLMFSSFNGQILP